MFHKVGYKSIATKTLLKQIVYCYHYESSIRCLYSVGTMFITPLRAKTVFGPFEDHFNFERKWPWTDAHVEQNIAKMLIIFGIAIFISHG